MKKLCAILGLVLFCFSCTNANHTSTTKLNVDQQQNEAEKGEILFKDKCAACHSVQIKMFGPALTLYTDSDKNIIKSYKNIDSSHVSCKVSREELRDIQAYVNKNSLYIN